MKNKINIDEIPNLCGVYLFKDQDSILYIGKAKNLKKRIQQYLNGSINSYKTPLLLEKANNLDFIVCSNEKEALLLEQELIKKNKPYYNILLLDDKKFPYIVIQLKPNKLEFKTKFFYKQVPNTYYYGPLPPNYGYKTIKNFLIRECLYKNGLPIQTNDNEFWKEKFIYAKKILSSSNNEIISRLKHQMIEASENEQYELAKDYRDVIQYLTNKSSQQSISFSEEKNFDVIVFLKHDSYLLVLVHYFKNGIFFMQEDFVVEIKIDFYESMRSFINSFYSIRNQPDMIVTNYEIEKEDLIFDKTILKPKKGQYLQAVNNALKNIEINKTKKILEFKNKENSISEIRLFFNQIIKKEINDFIVIDNSNENNKDIVSVIIYYKNYLPYFSNYRKYTLSNDLLSRKSDVEYIKIGLTKYFSKEEKPDLIIVDGGKQQINEAIKVKKELNIQLPIIGLVKNEKHSTEYLITEQKKKVLLKNKSIYNFLARIQNEVDSYAKNFHLKKKINSSLEGFLTSISGIGLKTEEKLLKHFHTYANIYNANEDELSKVVSKSVAKKIIEKLEK